MIVISGNFDESSGAHNDLNVNGPSADDAGWLEPEIKERLTPPMIALAERFGDQVSGDARYIKVLESFRQIRSGLVEAIPTDPEAAKRWGQVREAFTDFSRAWLLAASGMRAEQIGREVCQPAKAWIKGTPPLAISRIDPERRELNMTPVRIPEGESADLARILGAVSAILRPKDKISSITFHHVELAPIETLQAAFKAACGLDLAIHPHKVGKSDYNSIATGAHKLVSFLEGVFGANETKLCNYVLSASERRSFLGGFFDFCNGTVVTDLNRFAVVRFENTRLMRDVGILLKHEGVPARFEVLNLPDGRERAALYIDDSRALTRLRDSGLITAEKQRKPLEEICRKDLHPLGADVEVYEAAMEAAEDLGFFRGVSVSTTQIRRAMSAAGVDTEVKRDTLRDWITGKTVPPAVRRLRNLNALEEEAFPMERKREIGEQMIQRIGREHIRQPIMVNALVEWVGGKAELGRLSGLPIDRIDAVLEKRELLRPEEYRKALAVMGLRSIEALTPSESKIDALEIESWDLPEKLLPYFRTYRAAMVTAAREADLFGDDPRETVLNSLKAIAKRAATG